MKKYAAVVLLNFLLIGFASGQVQWQPNGGTINFTIKNAGFNTKGTLSGMTAIVRFDSENTSQSYIEAKVKVETIDTGISARDKHLKNEDYFDVGNYPEIIMKSTKIKAFTDGTFSADFDLTIKDVTKSIEVPFEFTQNGNLGTFTGNFEINRVEYHVGEGSMTLSDKVEINIVLEVKK